MVRVEMQKTQWRSRIWSNNFGHLITSDHKVLSESCESRNNHRYAIVVQGLTTQGIHSFPCKTKLLRKHKGVCKSSWSRFGSLKSCTLPISWNLATFVKVFLGIIVRQHHTDREQKGLLREQCGRIVKQVTSALLLQSGLDEKSWADFMKCSFYLRTCKIFCLMGKHVTNCDSRASRICRISFPLLLSRRAFVMSGSSMTGSVLLGPCSLIGGYARWTLPWPPLVPLGVALPLVTLRALLGSYAHPSAFTSLVVGTPAYVRDTVVVLSPDAGTTALGSAFGTREQINARAWESVRACDEVRSAINGVDHAPTELVLTRQCADVSKLMYHMRINGDILDHDLLASFDGQLRASVSNSLSGDLPDHSWWQATTGVTVGGLGLRTAVTVALPAFVASRILSRPFVVTMVDHLCAAIGPSRQTIMAEYDARTDEALPVLLPHFPLPLLSIS